MIRFLVKPAFDQVKRRVKRKLDQISNLSLPYKRASVYLHKWVIDNFQSEGGKVGGWQPFSPVTLAAIERNDPGRIPAKLLQKTGALRQSFVPFSTKRNAGVGTGLPYSQPHEEGLGNVPQRRMLPEREEVLDDIRKILNDHIRDAGNA